MNYMKSKMFPSTAMVFVAAICFMLCSNSLRAQCTNADLSQGNFTGWTGTWSDGLCTGVDLFGTCTGCSVPLPFQNQGFVIGPMDSAPGDTAHHHITSAGHFDTNPAMPSNVLPTVFPGSLYAARLGNTEQNTGTNGDAESMSYTFAVTPGNCNFIYHYALVVADGGHMAGEQAYFKVQLVADSMDTISCGTYQVDATRAHLDNFDTSSVDNTILYKPWSSVYVPLAAYIGRAVKITFITCGCTPSGCAGSHYAYAYISAECGSQSQPLGLTVSNSGSCAHPGDTTYISAPIGLATYTWTGPGILSGDTSRTVMLNQPGHYTVTMTTFGNTPCTISLDTVIGSGFGTLQANFSYTDSCVGNAVAFSDLSSPHNYISSWAWDFNNDGITDDTTENPVHTFGSTGTYPVKLTIHGTGCSIDTTINVVVIPRPTSTFTLTSPVCEGNNSVITYTGTGNNHDNYNWFFDGGSVVLGTGAGPYYVNWSTGGVKNVGLQVISGSCTSVLTTVSLTVNPYPVLALTGDSAACSGTNLTLSATGAVNYTWWAGNVFVSNTPSIHVSADSTTTFVVTGTASNCSTSDSVTVSVVQSPVASFIVSAPVCAGDSITVTFNGSANNQATFNWNFGLGQTGSTTGSGPFNVVWPGAGNAIAELTVSQNGCLSSYSDTLIVEICEGVQSLSGDGIKIYPNPAHGEVSVELADPISTGQIELHNALGQRIYTNETDRSSTGYIKHLTFDAAPGVYLLSITNGTKKWSQKLVIE